MMYAEKNWPFYSGGGVGTLRGVRGDFAAEVAAPPGPDDIITHDLTLDGPAGPLSARLYVPPSAPALSGAAASFLALCAP